MRRFIYYNSGVSAGYSYIVDDYSPLVALGVLKLSSTATNCIRVRRSSDNSEQDIGFSGDDLDTASLLSFTGASDGYVVKVYNQGTGGTTYDLTQVALAYQPRIVSSGTTVTVNGKPAIDFYMVGTVKPPMNIGTTGNYQTIFSVFQAQSINTINYYHTDGSKGTFIHGSFSGVNGVGAFDGTNVRSTTGEDFNQHVAYWNTRTSNLYVSVDGGSESNIGSFASNIPVNQIAGRNFGASLYADAYMQTDILFTTDESANITAIKDILNTYFTIY